MAKTLADSDWKILLKRIEAKTCTPFIGAGACAGTLPLGADIAREWAKDTNYPFPLSDTGDNLSRVAQFWALSDPIAPKEDIQSRFKPIKHPNFSDNEPHALLADLQLPIYITTNYDNFMVEALRTRHKRNSKLDPCEPQRELCRWNKIIEEETVSIFGTDEEKTNYVPTVEKPLVYHLHGHYDTPQSMVLTEDDYLDFLVNLSRENQTVLPPAIRTAMSKTSLLFIGYSLSDWNFRVLFRTLVGSEAATHSYPSIAVQLTPSDLVDDSEEGKIQAQEYMQKYFGTIQKNQVKVYWGKATEFTSELRERWEKFKNDTE